MFGHDRTKPVEAPEGMKWVIYLSNILDYRYEIGLFPGDAEVDKFGTYKVRFDPKPPMFPKGGWIPRYAKARCPFDRERSIRWASQRALFDYLHGQVQRDRDRRILGRIR